MPPHLASAPNINHLWAALLVEELVRQGTTFFVVCPGSRSTPLAVAVAQNPRAETLVHWDERAAGFVALGWGRAQGRPAAVVTTSGTAVANLLPAAVEADADNVPLLLITADRPPELRETGANQTIRQPPIFQDVARWTLDWPVPTTDVSPRWVLSTAAHAVHRAASGPVHLNLPFREPLGTQPDGLDVTVYLRDIGRWIERPIEEGESYTERDVEAGRVGETYDGVELVGAVWHLPLTSRSRPKPDHRGRSDKQRHAGVETDLSSLADRLRRVERGVIVIGALDADFGGLSEAALSALDVAAGLGWPVLPDVRSSLRLIDDLDRRLVPHVDLLLASESFRESHRPEAVLHLGGRLVSKRLQRFLTEAGPALYVHVHDPTDRIDPDGIVTEHVMAPTLTVVDSLSAEVEDHRQRVDPAWIRAWVVASGHVEQALRSAVDEGAISEPYVARSLSRRGPLVVAASMPIRDVEAFGAAEVALPVAVYANRGASGIDGTVAMAAGVSRAGAGVRMAGTPLWTLVGDLALLHDQTSLALLRSGPPVVVVVINNDGGGIFHRLPIASGPGALADDTFERFFGTPHGLTFEHAAAQFGLDYHRPETAEAFEQALDAATTSGASALIEVRTDREEQAALRRRIEAAVAEAVDAALA